MKETKNDIEIHFGDLNEDAKKKFLEAMGIETSSKRNLDIIPIAVIPKPEMDDGNSKNEDIHGRKQSKQDTKKTGIDYENYQGSFQLFPSWEK